LKRLFDDVTGYEAHLAMDKEDRECQELLGRARTVYDFTKSYVEETASKQEGAPAEDTSSSNTGAYVKQEVEIYQSEADELEAMVAAQRAAEQAAVKAAVDAANAEVEAARLAQEETARKQAEAAAAAAEAAAEVKRLEDMLAAAEAEGTRRRKLAIDDPENHTLEEIRAMLETANGAANKANEEAAAAEAEAVKVAEEVAAAKKKVNKAYTTKPVIEGAVSLEDRIKNAFKKYSAMKLELNADKENLDLQYKTSYLWTRYQKMKQALAAAEVAEREADPAAFRAAEAAKEKAGRDAEKAAALPAEEKV